MIPRDIRIIENEILAHKEIFDNRYLEGVFYGHYSRISLQREWEVLQRTVKPLVDELNANGAYWVESSQLWFTPDEETDGTAGVWSTEEP